MGNTGTYRWSRDEVYRGFASLLDWREEASSSPASTA